MPCCVREIPRAAYVTLSTSGRSPNVAAWRLSRTMRCRPTTACWSSRKTRTRKRTRKREGNWMATLYKTCPKCGAAAAGFEICAGCGLIFAKYLRAKFASPQSQARPANAEPDEDGEDSLLSQAKALVLYVPEEVDRGFVYGRAILLAGVAFLGAKLSRKGN